MTDDIAWIVFQSVICSLCDNSCYEVTGIISSSGRMIHHWQALIRNHDDDSDGSGSDADVDADPSPFVRYSILASESPPQ
jgi:hypothetical protein